MKQLYTCLTESTKWKNGLYSSTCLICSNKPEDKLSPCSEVDDKVEENIKKIAIYYDYKYVSNNLSLPPRNFKYQEFVELLSFGVTNDSK